jgi:gas vesicle protein
MTDTKSNLKILGAVLLGGLAAAGITLLVAPQSGRQTRHKIQENLLEAGQRARMALDDTRSQVKDKARQWASGANQEISQTSKEIWHKGSQFVKRNGSLVEDRAEKVLERL